MQQQQPPPPNMGHVSANCPHFASDRTNPLLQSTPPAPVVEYIQDPAVAVAAAYSNLNPMYSAAPYAATSDNLYMTPTVHSSNFYPVSENLYHQYRLQGVGGYYPAEYHPSTVPTSYVANGFLPYDSYGLSTKDEKWQEGGKYYSGHDITSRSMYADYGSPTGHTQVRQRAADDTSKTIFRRIQMRRTDFNFRSFKQH